jgi:hypothetical protein
MAVAPIIGEEFAWLQEDPILWPDYDEYVSLGKWVDQLQVVNAAAERAVKNAQEVADVTWDPAHRDNVIYERSPWTCGTSQKKEFEQS